MSRVIGSFCLVFFLFSCGQTEKETNVVDEKDVEVVLSDSVVESIDSVLAVHEDSLIHLSEIYFGDGIIFTEATVLSVGEELVMPSDYLTTSMHVATDKGDTLVFLDISIEEVVKGQRISLYYKMEKAEDVLLCLDCTEYSGKVSLIDVTLLAGELEYKSLKLIKCTTDDYLVLNANFEMEDKAGSTFSFKTLDYRMIDDTAKMYEGFYSYGVVSQYHPVLETFE